MAGLNNEDQVIGGAGTKDYLTATSVTGLTATTGKLNIQDVEKVELNATGANTIDASLLSGVDLLAFSGANPGVQTVTNLAAGVKIGIGDAGAEFDAGDDIDVSLADETGAADSLQFDVDDTTGGATDADILTSDSIETVTINFLDTDTARDSVISIDKTKAATLIAKGGTAAGSVTFGTAAPETTTFDFAEFDGDFLLTTGAVLKGVTVTTAAGQADTDITLSSRDDTLTVAETGAVAFDYDGGAGTDTINLNIKAGAENFGEVDNFEKVNLIVRAGDDITSGTADTENDDGAYLNGISEATTVTITGGNELSTLHFGDFDGIADDNITTAVDIDASAFGGNIEIEFNTGILTTSTDVDAGSMATDKVLALFDATNTDIEVPFTGVETFIAMLNTGDDASQEQYTFDVDEATGLTHIALTSSNGEDTLVDIDDYVSTVTVQLGGDEAQARATGTVAFEDSSEVDINLKASGGSEDTANLFVVDTGDDAATDTNDIDAAGVEILNIKLDTATESHKLDLAGVSPSTGSNVKIVLTGGVAGDGIELSTVHAKTNIIDGSALEGSLTVSDRGSSAVTITGGNDNDTLRMENTADTIDGGAGNDDVLNVVKSAILGGIKIDLTSTTDQITTFNGSSNAEIQKGFENVNLAGYTGSFGADVTGSALGSTITGTVNSDVITLENATTNIADVIVFDSGVDGTKDLITNFVVGTSKDTIRIDLSAFEAVGAIKANTVLDLIDIHDNNSVVAGTAIVIDDLTADASALDTENLFHINGATYASADLAVDALEAGGTHDLSFAGSVAANDAFLFAYETGSAVRLATAIFVAADDNSNTSAATGVGNLDGVDLMEFTDITVFDNFVAGNFNFA